MNSHGFAEIVGVIDPSNEEKYLGITSNNSKATLYAIDENDTEYVLFSGIINELEIFAHTDFRKMRVRITAMTSLMDIMIYTRTFQDASATYADLLNSLGQYPDYAFIMSNGNSTPIEKLIVQYRETDWEFAKRLASHFNLMLVPSFIQAKTHFYFGAPFIANPIQLNDSSIQINRRLGEFEERNQRGVNITENDITNYIVRSREILEIGAMVSLLNRTLCVYEINSQLEGSELIHIYTLRTQKGFLVPRIENPRTIGASLEARVIEINADIVRVHAIIDSHQEAATARWFSYSSVFSSPDGTGWYAMPEEGDSVRLYFPSVEEEEAYVISAVHLETDTDLRSDPNIHSLRNRHNQEIQLTPTGITLTNNKGIAITIDDETGIFIESNKDINIKSKGEIAISSVDEQVAILATKGVELTKVAAEAEGIGSSKDNSRIVVSEKIIFSGNEVNIE